MIKKKSFGFPLRALAAAVLLCGTVPAWTTPVALHALEFKGEGDLLRVQLETQVGVVGNVTMKHGGRETLLIELKDVTKAEIEALIKDIAARTALVRDVRALPGLDGRSLLEVQLARSLQVLDETVVAMAGGRSRWELVLGEPDAARKPLVAADVKPALGGIVFSGREDRLDLTLNGSAGLVAEVSFAESPSRLIVELPGVPKAQLQQAVQGIEVLPPMVRSVQIEAGAGKVGRLVFELNGSGDLVDVGGTAQGEAGNVQMSVVPDLAPTNDRRARLLHIKTVQGDGGVDLAFGGAAAARVNTFTLDNPPRVVVDMLGWRPDQVKTAASRFASDNPVVQRVAVTETRLGSARLVFELASQVALGGKTYPEAQTGRTGSMQLALRPLPDAGGMLARRNLDLRYRHDLQDFRRSGVTIRPVQLDGPYAKAVVPPQPGTRFRLIEMLDRAKDVDAKFGVAKAEFEAMSESIPQARAGLLPVAALDFQRSSINQDVIKSPNPAFPPNSTQYPSTTWNLTITQPLIRPQAFVRMSQAKVTVEQAQLNLVAAEQDLMLRVANGYLSVLAANDNLELIQAEREATGKQLELATARLQSGLGTATQLHETEARYALTEAKEIEAKNRLDDAKAGLKELVGVNVSSVKGFKRDFLASPPRPARVDSWVQAALEQNLALQARNLAVEIAALEVTRMHAGHLPTVDLVGTASKQKTEGSLYGQGQEIENREIGVKVRVPLFEGGMTSSLAREAQARRSKATEERELEYRKTERQTRAAFLGVQASASTLEALRKTVLAQESALEAKLEGYSAGLQSVVSVVDAYRLYFAARRDYLQSRYDYLTNRLKLKQSVGALARNDLEDLASLLE